MLHASVKRHECTLPAQEKGQWIMRNIFERPVPPPRPHYIPAVHAVELLIAEIHGQGTEESAAERKKRNLIRKKCKFLAGSF